MSETRVGIVGTGFAAGAHIEALRRVNGPRVAAISASSQEKAAVEAARLGVDASFGDYNRMLDSGAVDAVHNCTPNHLHLEVNRAVLERGLHLLSEKPLAVDSAETEQLVEASQRDRIVSGVCFNYRHFPLVRESRDQLLSGRFGRAHFVHGSYLQDWLLKPEDWNWRLDSSRAGRSRAVADIGSHWLDNVEYVTGDRVTEVFAQLFRLHEQRLRPRAEAETFRSGSGETQPFSVDTEDGAVVSLRFSSGMKGALTVSQVSPGRKNRLSWQVDAGSASLAWNQEEPNRLWIGRRDEANAELVRDPSLLGDAGASLAHLPGGHQEGWADGLKNLMIDFYSAVDAARRGDMYEASFATFSDAHHITQVVEAIVESDRSERWVKVDE